MSEGLRVPDSWSMAGVANCRVLVQEDVGTGPVFLRLDVLTGPQRLQKHITLDATTAAEVAYVNRLAKAIRGLQTAVLEAEVCE